MRWRKTDYEMLTVVVVVLLGFAGTVWLAVFYQLNVKPADRVPALIATAAGCAVVGWFVQALLVTCGIQVIEAPDAAQAADYGDGSRAP